MNAKHTVLALSLLALVGVSEASERRGSAHGDRGPRAEQHQPRESFSEETVRKSADGKISKRKTEQTVTDTGFSRKSTFTNPEGKTATRELSSSFDKDKQSYTRSEKGRDFDGKSWSRQATTERTSDGYQREGEWTNRHGGHGHREASVSRNGDTVTKEVTVSKADGSTTEKTTTRQAP